jgi:hypothetical protein
MDSFPFPEEIHVPDGKEEPNERLTKDSSEWGPLYHFSSIHETYKRIHIHLPFYWSIVSLIVALSLVVVLWIRTKRKPTSRRRLRSRDQGGSQSRMDGMEILRTTRERSSTFDFFGISLRERSQSLDSFGPLDYRRDRDRSDSLGPTDFRRERMGSMDLFYASKRDNRKSIHAEVTPSMNLQSPRNDTTSENFFSSQMANVPEDEGYLYDEFGLVTLSFHVEYYGPSHTALKYSTWTPPTSWAEASRRIIPQDIMLKLQRDLMLDVSKAIIEVKEPKSSGVWDFSLPLQDISIHVTPPVEGGVISLYVKGSPKEDWMEHTFESASDAAQFQLDLLGYQVVGKTLHHMFEVLSLVHLGSLAYDGQEFVLHDDRAVQKESNEDAKDDRQADKVSGGCVAWDDAMRALSSIPTIRIALERLWLKNRRSSNLDYGKISKGNSTSNEEEPHEGGLLAEDYSNKRLLLGQVDFFRLFVPALPETALPQSESNRARMEQLLSWRKRAARAAVLVRAYTMSHRVVNLGWKLSYPVQENLETFTKRLAFDDNEDNNRRDIKAKNEYYEASVSRDVLCHVRPFDYFSQSDNENDNYFAKRRLVLSPYQAYSLVGAHMFKIPAGEESDHPLYPSRDPVAAFPSLQRLISDNPELDFFVSSFYNRNIVTICCYVRSLPKGIDPQFDNVVSQIAPTQLTQRV